MDVDVMFESLAVNVNVATVLGPSQWNLRGGR
jgi:hypothetical protein